MKKWSPIHTLMAGIALILITNAIALAGVVYNRSGSPESTLQLTQRELQLPYDWRDTSEDSGITLNLRWRVLGREAGTANDSDMGYPYLGWEPAWLDKAKLASLGFDISEQAEITRSTQFYEKQLPKDVLLVLELDGAAYREALKRAHVYSERIAAKLAAYPNNDEIRKKAKEGGEYLEREESENSRLFVIDAGLDRATLRAHYPDRNHYAIVRGQIRIEPACKGYIRGISIDRINVLAVYRRLFEPMFRDHPRYQRHQKAGYTVTIAYGERLEPWIIAAKGG
jgi:hypothetical protein